jgi:K+-sensing histidine kinase KdpD
LADEALIVLPPHSDWEAPSVRARSDGDEAVVEEGGQVEAVGSAAAAIAEALAGRESAFLPATCDDSGEGPRVVALPLRAGGKTLAALALSREPSGRRFSSADLTMAEALASRAAMALENARLYRDLKQADRQKDEFLSMLAHELRNPLAPIRAAVAVLQAV